MPYESGMDPVGDARQHFDIKFYLMAILFLVFDVELLFLYPWAVVAYRDVPSSSDWAAFAGLRTVIFWEVVVFLVTLALAYVYAWRKGVFQWRESCPPATSSPSPINSPTGGARKNRGPLPF